MRVCILRHAYFPDDPRERKQVSALLQAGHEVEVVCLRRAGQRAFERVDGARVHRLPLSHRRAGIARYLLEYGVSFALIGLTVTRLHLRQRFDVVQVSTMPDFLVFASLIPKLMGARVLLDLHEPTPELWLTKYGERQRFLYRLQRGLEQRAIAYADRAITVTLALQQRFIERGADAEKLGVVPNVSDDRVFAPAGPPDCNWGGELRLISHGAIEERYGHELMIRAVARLRGEIPGIRLDIAGSGDAEESLRRLAAELGVSDRVAFLGFLDFDILLAKLRAAHIGIIAMRRSPYSELVDTNKMYEYISLKKPVVASRLPALEANFDERALTYFEPGDADDLARALRELYHAPGLAVARVEQAHRVFQDMKWSISGQAYRELIESLGAPSGGATAGAPSSDAKPMPQRWGALQPPSRTRGDAGARSEGAGSAPDVAASGVALRSHAIASCRARQPK